MAGARDGVTVEDDDADRCRMFPFAMGMGGEFRSKRLSHLSGR